MFFKLPSHFTNFSFLLLSVQTHVSVSVRSDSSISIHPIYTNICPFYLFTLNIFWSRVSPLTSIYTCIPHFRVSVFALPIIINYKLHFWHVTSYILSSYIILNLFTRFPFIHLCSFIPFSFIPHFFRNWLTLNLYFKLYLGFSFINITCDYYGYIGEKNYVIYFLDVIDY